MCRERVRVRQRERQRERERERKKRETQRPKERHRDRCVICSGMVGMEGCTIPPDNILFLFRQNVAPASKPS
jgi:hypothetical protein